MMIYGILVQYLLNLFCFGHEISPLPIPDGLNYFSLIDVLVENKIILKDSIIFEALNGLLLNRMQIVY